jgi:hypothetical protein
LSNMVHVSVALAEALDGIKRKAKDGTNRGRKPTHGMTDSPEHRSWHAMNKRCHCATDPAYARYGGAGIKVCEAWRGNDGFAAFFEALGPRPKNTTLDRIDNTRGYDPGNCRWATARQQAANRKNSRLITAHGKTQCIAAWARETGIPEDTIRNRVLKFGWDPIRAVTEPARCWGKYRYGPPRAPVRESRHDLSTAQGERRRW